MAEDMRDNQLMPKTPHLMITSYDDHYYGDNSNDSADEVNANRLPPNEAKQRRKQYQRLRGQRVAVFGDSLDYCLSQESDDNSECMPVTDDTTGANGVDLSLMRECVNCSTQKTSQWRTNGSGHYLCNACGLYKKYNGEDRPPASLVVSRKKNCSAPKQCSNCGTLTSSMWRRTANKEVACNACGLYYKLYGKYRPIEMRKDVVYPRNRYSKIVANNGHLSDETPGPHTTDDSAVDPPVGVTQKSDFYKPFVAKTKKVKRKLKSIINTRIKHNMESTDDEKPIDFKQNSPSVAKPSSLSLMSESSAAEPIISSYSDMHRERTVSTITDCFRQCAKCGANVVTQFGAYFGHYLCNDCGIPSKQFNPLEDNTSNDSKSGFKKKGRDMSCSNCGVTVSSEWRRNPSGQPVCNACGLYFKLHLKNRPIHMRRDFISHRKRTAVTPVVPIVHSTQHFNHISSDCRNIDVNNRNNSNPQISQELVDVMDAHLWRQCW
ncbi:unnamed protein product [Oppiella nova]|uniref:GATA-type domain-containing protein n=1 Tax=Oppiella nova TaxID=334625 RepID=A0A7R9M8V9_9ACAR|nr:unnamed protein product [Oppiella nova]CAG2172950.1 unnamed protein product [Oppiella nova]